MFNINCIIRIRDKARELLFNNNNIKLYENKLNMMDDEFSYLFKIILIGNVNNLRLGDSGVGKTNLFNRL